MKKTWEVQIVIRKEVKDTRHPLPGSSFPHNAAAEEDLDVGWWVSVFVRARLLTPVGVGARSFPHGWGWQPCVWFCSMPFLCQCFGVFMCPGLRRGSQCWAAPLCVGQLQGTRPSATVFHLDTRSRTRVSHLKGRQDLQKSRFSPCFSLCFGHFQEGEAGAVR